MSYFLDANEECCPCDGICQVGCYEEGLCNGCVDDVCEICDNFEDCDSCIEGAV